MRPWRKKVDRKKSISLPSGENHLKSHKIKHSPCHFPNSLLLVTNENNVLFTQLSPVRASHVKSPLFFLGSLSVLGEKQILAPFPLRIPRPPRGSRDRTEDARSGVEAEDARSGVEALSSRPAGLSRSRPLSPRGRIAALVLGLCDGKSCRVGACPPAELRRSNLR